jgi:hypothetical protein
MARPGKDSWRRVNVGEARSELVEFKAGIWSNGMAHFDAVVSLLSEIDLRQLLAGDPPANAVDRGCLRFDQDRKRGTIRDPPVRRVNITLCWLDLKFRVALQRRAKPLSQAGTN